MDTFDPPSVSEIKHLLKRSSDTFCVADLVPVQFVKECQNILICPTAKIGNTSLFSGLFPLSLKAALVKPIIKTHN